MTQIRIPAENLPPPDKYGNHDFQFRIVSADKNQNSAWSQLHSIKSIGQYRPLESDSFLRIFDKNISINWNSPDYYNYDGASDAIQGNNNEGYFLNSASIVVRDKDQSLKKSNTNIFLKWKYNNLDNIIGKEFKFFEDVHYNSNFANILTMSCDGNTLITFSSKQFPDEGNIYKAYLHIFVKIKEDWIEKQTILFLNNDKLFFAISDNGETIAVAGSDKILINGLYYTKAYVYVKNNDVWGLEKEIILPAPSTSVPFDLEDSVVDLSGDGNTLVCSNYADSTDSLTHNGSVYVYTRSDSIWTQKQIITAIDKASYNRFGSSISLSSNGQTLAIGSFIPVESGYVYSNKGQIYIYNLINDVWTFQQKILTSNTQNSNVMFGASLDLSSDGNTLITSSPIKDNSDSYGSVLFFKRNESNILNTWELQQTIDPVNTATFYDFNFGRKVAISKDGSVAIISSGRDSTYPLEVAPDEVYVYYLLNELWLLKGKITSPVTNIDFDNYAYFDRFANSISLSSDGSIITISNSPNTSDTADYGKFWTFKDRDFVYSLTASGESAEIIIPKNAISVRAIGVQETKDVPKQKEYEIDYDFNSRINSYMFDEDEKGKPLYELFKIFDTGTISLPE